jgi:hypothetical protein
MMAHGAEIFEFGSGNAERKEEGIGRRFLNWEARKHGSWEAGKVGR